MRDAGCGARSFRVAFILKVLFCLFLISFFLYIPFLYFPFPFTISSSAFYPSTVQPFISPTFFLPLPSTVHIPTLLQLYFSPLLYSRFRTSISPRFLPAVHQLSTIAYRISPIDRQVHDLPSRIFTLLHFLHLWIFNPRSGSASSFDSLPTPYSRSLYPPFFDYFNPFFPNLSIPNPFNPFLIPIFRFFNLSILSIL